VLTHEQQRFYREQGYVLIENALSDQQLHALRDATIRLTEASRHVQASDDVYELDAGHSAATPRLQRIKLPHLRDPVYWDVLTSERFQALLRQLLGPDVRLHTSKLNTKGASGGAGVEWHQDWAFYPHTNDDLLAIGVMLDDMTEDNGPLQIIPGSHRGPVLSHFHEGVFCGAIDPQDADFDASHSVTLTGPAGSISVHHVRALHGSAINRSGSDRRLLLYECGAADAWPINGSASPFTGVAQQTLWEDMQRCMICGKQPKTARLAAVPVTMPVPPPATGGSIFAVQRSGGARSAFTG